jgi:hypothetical protein
MVYIRHFRLILLDDYGQLKMCVKVDFERRSAPVS